MRRFQARLFPGAAVARERVLAASWRTAAVFGLAAGLATVATAALLVEAIFVLVGLAASVSVIDGIGDARFVVEGMRSDLPANLSAAARGGIALLFDIWIVLVAIAATGPVAAVVLRRVGQARAAWGFTGAWLTFFALAVTGFMIWTRQGRLAFAEALVNAEFWTEPGRLHRLIDSDAGFLASAGVAAYFSAGAAYAIWRWWFTRFVGREAVRAPFQRQTPEDLDPNSPAAYREYQERMRRLKRDSLELRTVETRFSRPDPILDSTHVVDRQVGRSVPEWMEPMAEINSLLGKPLLAVFILAAFLWFGMSLAGQRQEWLPQRGAVVFNSDDRAKAIVLTVDDSAGVLRLFGLMGRGFLEIELQPPKGGEKLTLATSFLVDSPQAKFVRGSPGPTHDFTGGPDGEYRLFIRLIAGDRVDIGYALGWRTPDRWHAIALLMGIAGAGLVFSGVGLTMIGAANFAAYWQR